jgi:hypothetical protein
VVQPLTIGILIDMVAAKEEYPGFDVSLGDQVNDLLVRSNWCFIRFPQTPPELTTPIFQGCGVGIYNNNETCVCLS